MAKSTKNNKNLEPIYDLNKTDKKVSKKSSGGILKKISFLFIIILIISFFLNFQIIFSTKLTAKIIISKKQKMNFKNLFINLDNFFNIKQKNKIIAITTANEKIKKDPNLAKTLKEINWQEVYFK